MEEESQGPGRPSDYDPKYCDEIVEFMKDGSSIVAFAAHIGVVDSTIYEWAKKHPEFSRAKKVALQKSQAWWESQARDGLFMGERQSFSQSVWIFNMKARFGYRDKQEVDLSHSGKVELGYNLNYHPSEFPGHEKEEPTE